MSAVQLTTRRLVHLDIAIGLFEQTTIDGVSARSIY
jgi:hypothetical protein